MLTHIAISSCLHFHHEIPHTVVVKYLLSSVVHGNHKQEVDNPMTYRKFPMHPLLSGCLGVTIIHMTIPSITSKIALGRYMLYYLRSNKETSLFTNVSYVNAALELKTLSQI